MAAELLIVGTSGLAKEAAQLARQIDPSKTRWERIAYVAEHGRQRGQAMPYGEVRYTDTDLAGFTSEVEVVIGIGHPGHRRRIAEKLLDLPQLLFPNLVHPDVSLDTSYVSLGRGNIVCKGTVLTCDIVVRDFSWLNLNVTVGHDAVIGSYCVVNPGTNISGKVTLGDECLLGTGCQVLEGLSITSGTVVGAGAVVTRPIVEAGTYVGIPARKLA